MSTQQQSNGVVIVDFSNRPRPSSVPDEQKRSISPSNLTRRAQQLESLQVEIASLNTDYKSRAETKTAQDEIAKRDAQITTLETKNVDLSSKWGTSDVHHRPGGKDRGDPAQACRVGG